MYLPAGIWLSLTNEAVNKGMKGKGQFCRQPMLIIFLEL